MGKILTLPEGRFASINIVVKDILLSNTPALVASGSFIMNNYDQLFIGGEWVEPSTGNRFESPNPASGQPWASVAEGRAEDIDRAVKAARSAFENGPWRNMAASQRSEILRRLGDLVLKHSDRLAKLETTDNGKAIRETGGVEMPAIAKWYYYFAGLAETIEGTTIPVNNDLHVHTVKEPVGVCGCILPWNSPLLMAAFKLAPALAAGNTVVLKPSENTPVSILEFAHLIRESGIPPGVVNIVPGFGSEAGKALAQHPLVDKVAFTGGTETGKLIAHYAADGAKRVSLELGGKSPNIIFDDYDVEEAVAGAMSGIFVAAGQTCVAGSRLFVHEKIYDEFLDLLVERARKIRVGNPLDPATQMGAQTCQTQLDKIKELVQSGIDQGASLMTGGKPPENAEFASGYFFLPTVFSELKMEMRIAREEIFGPVVSVFRFSEEEEVIEKANDVKYSLAAGLWTRDIKRALRVSRRLKAGSVWINCYRKINWAVPFGGFKMSGYGRENGQEALDLYTQTKAVWIDISEDYIDPYNT